MTITQFIMFEFLETVPRQAERQTHNLKRENEQQTRHSYGTDLRIIILGI